MSSASLAGREASFAAKTIALVRKDLRIETRRRDTLPPMLAFSLAVTLLLAFTLPTTARLTSPLSTPAGTVPLVDVLSGFLWITILFAGLIGFARTFEVERSEGAVDSLLSVPVDRSSLFLAKTSANLTYVVLVQVFLVPVFLLLFQVSLGSGWLPLCGVIMLVDIGFVTIGTLFATLAARTTSRELMLPILALPALVPVFIAAVELTSDLLLGSGAGAIAERSWFGILIAFDVIFGVLGALAFDYALDS